MLSPEELASITEAVMGAIGTTVNEPPVIPPSDEPNVITPDSYLEVLQNAKAKVITNMIENGPDIVYVRGRRGVVEHNRTKDTLNMLDDQINDWKDRKTHRAIK